MPRTKIVCTIGPAPRSPAVLERLIRAGMSVARLNFSHGTLEEHARVVSAVRDLADRLDRPVAILQDLPGPKLRVGEIEGGAVTLEAGSTVTLTGRPVPGTDRLVSVSEPTLAAAVRPGDALLLSDGDLELEVLAVSGGDIHCRVVIGGRLASRKGINVPARSIGAASLTDEDRAALAFGLRQGVDYVALSFVRSAADVREARALIDRQGARTPLVAKIEKRQALEGIDAILEQVDGIMVARGDLGVETPLAEIPRVQKMLIAKANRAGKPVITATHMLRSMVESRRPTRAEVTDVANAILDGTDAVMLSEETAVGRYPVEAVATMVEIAGAIEASFPHDAWSDRMGEAGSVTEAVGRAACAVAAEIGAGAIVACTRSGSTARLIARHRPSARILAPTPREETYRRLALVWGVTPLRCAEAEATDRLLQEARRAVKATGLLQPDDVVVLTAGAPTDPAGTTNLIKVEALA
jgi:pyruvate kinase